MFAVRIGGSRGPVFIHIKYMPRGFLRKEMEEILRRIFLEKKDVQILTNTLAEHHFFGICQFLKNHVDRYCIHKPVFDVLMINERRFGGYKLALPKLTSQQKRILSGMILKYIFDERNRIFKTSTEPVFITDNILFTYNYLHINLSLISSNIPIYITPGCENLCFLYDETVKFMWAWIHQKGHPIDDLGKLIFRHQLMGHNVSMIFLTLKEAKFIHEVLDVLKKLYEKPCIKPLF